MARRQKRRSRGAKSTRKAKGETARGPQLKADVVAARVTEMITPLCAAEGMELLLVEYRREAGGRVLRLTIDKPGGVRVDDCVGISRQASDYLDVGLGIEEAYRLEVTSPGTERPLVRIADYERFKGNEARIRTREPVDGRKNFKGALLGTADGIVHLSVDGNRIAIAFDAIERGRLAG